MKILIKYKGQEWIAGGGSAAFTLCVSEAGATCSLGAGVSLPNGDLEHRIWINEMPVQSGDELIIKLVDSEETQPLIINIENQETRDKNKRDYIYSELKKMEGQQ